MQPRLFAKVDGGRRERRNDTDGHGPGGRRQGKRSNTCGGGGRADSKSPARPAD
jgi:hypothetical protein